MPSLLQPELYLGERLAWMGSVQTKAAPTHPSRNSSPRHPTPPLPSPARATASSRPEAVSSLALCAASTAIDRSSMPTAGAGTYARSASESTPAVESQTGHVLYVQRVPFTYIQVGRYTTHGRWRPSEATSTMPSLTARDASPLTPKSKRQGETRRACALSYKENGREPWGKKKTLLCTGGKAPMGSAFAFDSYSIHSWLYQDCYKHVSKPPGVPQRRAHTYIVLTALYCRLIVQSCVTSEKNRA